MGNEDTTISKFLSVVSAKAVIVGGAYALGMFTAPQTATRQLQPLRLLAAYQPAVTEIEAGCQQSVQTACFSFRPDERP